MVSLFLRAALVLVLIFGSLFVGGLAILTSIDAPRWTWYIFSFATIVLQYLLGPWILQVAFGLEWLDLSSLDPKQARFLDELCAENKIPVPRVGLARSKRLGAFSFGFLPRNARLVITTGLLNTPEEQLWQSIVSHEVRRIARWGFAMANVLIAIAIVFILFLGLIGSATKEMFEPIYTCYLTLRLKGVPKSSAQLIRQSKLLDEMTRLGGLGPDTVAMARMALERDLSSLSFLKRIWPF